VVKIFAFLGLEQNLAFFKGLTFSTIPKLQYLKALQHSRNKYRTKLWIKKRSAH